MKKFFLLVLLIISTQIPVYSSGRIKTEVYSPNKIVRLVVQVGRPVVIIFGEDENITFTTIGNTSEWDIKGRNNVLHLGAKSLEANSNLIVETDKRIYHIDLMVSERSGYFQLTYKYPLPENPHQYSIPNKKYPKNYLYYGFGDKEIKPELIYDDGFKTYLKFNSNLDLPTIYKVTPDGTEALIASHIEKGMVVIHEVAKRFNIRLGKKVLGIINGGKLRDTYSENHTTDDYYRVIKGR
ncbi:MAG: TrbG/VirB9 family P-type conjugative transfer protein [Neisseriaceae bacterium]|nr:TrbG/VirB9 family P-type conjugative transfer protein [Neisseriaceae bacterium]